MFLDRNHSYKWIERHFKETHIFLDCLIEIHLRLFSNILKQCQKLNFWVLNIYVRKFIQEKKYKIGRWLRLCFMAQFKKKKTKCFIIKIIISLSSKCISSNRKNHLFTNPTSFTKFSEINEIFGHTFPIYGGGVKLWFLQTSLRHKEKSSVSQ